MIVGVDEKKLDYLILQIKDEHCPKGRSTGNCPTVATRSKEDSCFICWKLDFLDPVDLGLIEV